MHKQKKKKYLFCSHSRSEEFVMLHSVLNYVLM